MKVYEFIQKAHDGGSPVPNEGGFDHGVTVYVVSKRELFSLLYRVTANDKTTKKEIEELLKEDNFIFREGDLPVI